MKTMEPKAGWHNENMPRVYAYNRASATYDTFNMYRKENPNSEVRRIQSGLHLHKLQDEENHEGGLQGRDND